jgi:hypothetical protein
MYRLQKYGLFFLLLIIISGCKKFETYPIEPAIEYIGLTKIPNGLGYDDKGILKIAFTDGDGDIGLSQGDTLPPFNPGSEYYYNFYIFYYEKQNGQYVKFEANPPIHARILPIVSDVSDRGIKGEIEIELEINNYFSPYDTVIFETYIYDRALHKSNIVRSPEIKIKK